MRRRRARPAVRRTGAGVEIDLPVGARTLIVSSVRQLRRELDAPGSAASRCLLGPLDESAPHDDPVVTLMRQHALDEVFDAVEHSSERDVLSDAEAEEWLCALGLVLAARTAELGLRTEEDRRAVGPRDEMFLQVMYAVQLGLIDALDAAPTGSPRLGGRS